ncbi:hypothetical protein E4U21_003525 [Claviceps maximensis]|nr:hypothetical protein E4U21_003525 [Claviceps maximensis]
MPDPAVHDAAPGRLSTSSSPFPSARTPAAEGPLAASPGAAPTPGSDNADESNAAAAAAVVVAAAATVASAKPSSAGATRPSLLSRLSLPQLPLRSRNRSLADFHIRCDEPHKKYSTGDSVRGAVVLAVIKPLRITHLVVALHGYVRVLKDPTSVAKAQNVTILPPPGSSCRSQYQGSGVTSLFQDEQVLSGEGRIETGKYEFGFDLVFPDKWLPSSIDFERGSISYTITATLTRPVSMAPTSTCERKVTVLQQIDVGLLSPPRPRTIFLEPISKRTRRKKSALIDKPSAVVAPEINDLTSEAGSSILTEDSVRGETSNIAPSEARVGSTTSDVYSEMSAESVRSVTTASRAADFAPLSHVGSTLTSAAKQQVVDDKTITATIELLKGGCLPGETVTVRVSVQHIKRVKSMTGVIVTLFRQSKIDTNPPPSLLGEASRTTKRLTKQDPSFPRLGGLSLCSSSSTSVFRKDLDQNAAPLIIDPATLQASVTVSVRIPDDAFPTIKGVPGDMISFKYLAEVIVDLGGRLTSQLNGASSASRVGTPGGTSADQNQTSSFGHQRGSNIADTSQVRGQKGVISVSLETVVGTIDSTSLPRTSKSTTARSRTIRIAEVKEEEEEEEEEEDQRPHHHGGNVRYDDEQEDGDMTRPDTISRNSVPAYGSSSTNGHPHRPPRGSRLNYTGPPRHPAGDPQRPRASTGTRSHIPHSNSDRHHYHRHSQLPPSARPPPPSHAAPSYVPSPQVPSEATMTEKERIRQAETRLLPSQPPAGPSAQAEEDNIYDAEDIEDTFRTPTSEPVVPSLDAVRAGPTAPPAEDVVDAGLVAGNSCGGSAGNLAGKSTATATEDKRELERQRLMAEASAPPEFPEDMTAPSGSHASAPSGSHASAPSGSHASAPASGSAPLVEPTALDFNHDGHAADSYAGYGVEAVLSRASGSEQLPAYQR